MVSNKLIPSVPRLPPPTDQSLAALKAWGAKNNTAISQYLSRIVATLNVQFGKSLILSVADYGAVGDGITDDSNAVASALDAAIANEASLYFPAGLYRCSSQIEVNLHSIATHGFKMFGEGQYVSRLVFDAAVTSPNFYIHANTGDDVVFVTIEDMGFSGNVNGVTFQIGNDALDDPFNIVQLNRLFITNSNTGGSAVACDLRYVVNSDINIVANGGGYNSGSHTGSGLAALRLNQVAFSTFRGSYGLSGIGVYLTNGFNFSNTFDAVDTEACTTCWKCDTNNAIFNRWRGGQISLATTGLDFTNGADNIFDGGRDAGGVTTFIGGAVGLYLRRAQPSSVGDSDYTILPTDEKVITAAVFTTARTWTLPAANKCGPGKRVKIVDAQGTVTSSNTLTVQRAGSDTINGSITSIVMRHGYAGIELESNGAGNWQLVGFVHESGGTATINGGSTSVTVTHGLSKTPAAKDIWFTPTENPTNDPGNMWIDTITSTQFNINCRADPGASNLDVSWGARIL